MSAHRPEDWEDAVAIPEVARPNRVLVPFDGSHNAERALAWAGLIARGTGVDVVVLVGYQQPLTMRGRGVAYVEAVRDDLAEEAKELAQEGVLALRGQGVTAQGVVLKDDIARGIIDTAVTENCDLIVMGRQGLTAEVGGLAGAVDRFKDLLQGGVCEKVTRHASVPVMVVP